MTEEELQKIKEHIEIHARREPRAIKITQILWKAVEELEATKELKEQLKSYEGYINDIPLVIDPCRQCKNEERKTEEQIEKCRLCCWYYTSNFELK